MSGVISKLFHSEWSLQFNCYETFHPWTPHCSEACLDIFFPCIRECLKIYALLNFVTLIVRRKYTLPELKASIARTFQSASFVAMTATFVYALFCLGNKISGNRVNHFLNLALVPNLAGLLGILAETPKRRGTLAVFCLNLATEIVFFRLIERGWLTPIPKGQVYLFATGLATYLYIAARKSKYDSDPIGFAFKHLLGHPKEQAVAMVTADGVALTDETECLNSNSGSQLFSGTMQVLKASAIGYAVPVVMKILFKPKLLMNLNSVRELITSEKSIRLSLFFGTLCAAQRISSHLLRTHTELPIEKVQFISGLVSGLSSFIYPSSSLSLHLFWRSAELFANEIALKYQLTARTSQSIASVVFAISCGHVFFTLPGQQRFVRKSYLDFLNRVTDNRVKLFNKAAFNLMGLDAFRDSHFVPNLELEHMSRKYIETIFLWTI
ncbi:putative transmembrane protein [Halotydeus destructor]|nr:putative transmembrane protein [Halotydeus destructor]